MQTDATLLANNTQHCWTQPVASVWMEPTTMLALVAYSLKPVKLLDPCKRTQHCWPTIRNIVGPNMLRPFAWNHNNVGTCCVQFEISQTFRPMQTDANTVGQKSLNNTQQCCDLLRPFACAYTVCTQMHCYPPFTQNQVWNRTALSDDRSCS